MSFEIYEYGYLCSKMLALPIEKVIHIIYYLVYARLASKPYIINLVKQARQSKKNLHKHTVKS